MRPMTCSTASSTSLTRLVTSPRTSPRWPWIWAAVGEALLELLAPDLGALESEHAQADHDVGGVPGGLGDLVGDVFELGHRGCPSCRESGVESAC